MVFKGRCLYRMIEAESTACWLSLFFQLTRTHLVVGARMAMVWDLALTLCFHLISAPTPEFYWCFDLHVKWVALLIGFWKISLSSNTYVSSNSRKIKNQNLKINVSKYMLLPMWNPAHLKLTSPAISASKYLSRINNYRAKWIAQFACMHGQFLDIKVCIEWGSWGRQWRCACPDILGSRHLNN